MILLVMGMGRSGTSLLMQVLQAAGFDCGSGWIADNENNPRGYFELKSVMNFNISLLKQASGDEESLYPLPSVEAINHFIGHPIPFQFPAHDFAVKDPRFSLTLPVWEPYLKQHDCRILFCRRNPEAIAESMARAYHIELQTSRHIIDEYIRRAEENTARFQIPLQDIVYEDWFTNPSANIEQIEKLIDRRLNLNLQDVLDADLYHCKGTPTVSIQQSESSQNLYAVTTDAEKENLIVLETLHPSLYQTIKDLSLPQEICLIHTDAGDYKGQYPSSSGKTVAWIVPAEFNPDRFPSMRYKQYVPSRQWLFVLGIDALCPQTLSNIELSPLSPVIIVEPDIIKLLSYFKTHSYIQLFRMPQVYWYVGERAFDAALEALDHEIAPFFVLESSVFPVFGGIAQSPYAMQAQPFMAAFQQKTRERFSYFSKQAQEFQQKYSKPVTPKKVMLVIPAIACWIVLGQGLAHGFRENGLDVMEYRVAFPPDKITPYDTLKLLQTIRDIQPDVLITLSHPSDLFVRGIEHIPIKRVVWYVDEPDHLIQKEHGKYDDIYFSWNEFGERLKNRKGNLKEEMIVGAFPLPHIKTDALYCEVGFVGSIDDQSAFRMQCTKDVLHELDQIVEKKLHQIKTPIQSLTASSALGQPELEHINLLLNPTNQRLGMTAQQALILYLHQECIQKRRLELVCALGGLDVKIFGSPTWEDLLRGTPIEGAYQGRGISYDECCNFYASCCISLNIHPPYLHSGPNQRDMDIPMCDGFLLTDLHLHAQERMSGFFAPDTEIALYNDAAELRKKVEYYLAHPDERTAVTQAAQARIQKDHLFSKRVKIILNNL